MPFFIRFKNWSMFVLFMGMFFSNQSFAQIPLQNINCSPSYVNVYSQGYATPAAALAGIFSQPKTGINVTTGNTIKQYALVKAGPDSSLGILNYFEVLYSVSPASVCTTALAASRRASLYRAVNGVCVGNEIQALQNGPNSSTFNYEYVNLEKD
ncbi:MAG: hypothetical protein KA797_04970, partial [Chitinophagales bacterium]|nr:hypothetical protein [Chitinophagales bacterium]